MDRRTALRVIAGTAIAAGAGGIVVFAGRYDALGPDDPRPTAARGEPSPTASPRHVEVGERPPREAMRHDGPAATVTERCREQWGAAPPAGEYGSHTITRLTVHHSAAPVGDGPWDSDRIRGHQAHHLDAGFVDLAYHQVIAPDGELYEGRPVDAPGETFTDYDPSGHLHVLLDGHFDQERPSDAQLDTLVAVLAWGAETFGADPTTIAGHQEHAATACPGANLQPLIDDGTIRSEVEALLAAGGVTLERTC